MRLHRVWRAKAPLPPSTARERADADAGACRVGDAFLEQRRSRAVLALGRFALWLFGFDASAFVLKPSPLGLGSELLC